MSIGVHAVRCLIFLKDSNGITRKGPPSQRTHYGQPVVLPRHLAAGWVRACRGLWPTVHRVPGHMRTSASARVDVIGRGLWRVNPRESCPFRMPVPHPRFDKYDRIDCLGRRVACITVSEQFAVKARCLIVCERFVLHRSAWKCTQDGARTCVGWCSRHAARVRWRWSTAARPRSGASTGLQTTSGTRNVSACQDMCPYRDEPVQRLAAWPHAATSVGLIYNAVTART